jgi:hypothetical protein
MAPPSHVGQTGAESRIYRMAGALFVISGSAVLLLYIGIHNARDTTMYVASGRAAAEAMERNAGAEVILAVAINFGVTVTE